jgi:hypothetical protein
VLDQHCQAASSKVRGWSPLEITTQGNIEMAKRASTPVSFDTPVSFGDPAPETPQQSVAFPGGNVISGVDAMTDGKTHVGIAIAVTSGGQTSVLMIPDVAAVKAGDSPVYITKPIKLELVKLNTFLGKKGIILPDEVQNLLKDTSVSCDAFYFTANTGPKLMQFTLQFNKGLIASLTKDDDIGALFDVKGAYVRYFQCDKDGYNKLKAYATELQADSVETKQ